MPALMAYVIGIILSAGVALFGRSSGFDRDRAFYATVLVVVGSYYVLFAAIGQSLQTVMAESVGLVAFTIAAVAGFKSSEWILVAGLAGHGIFDGLHGYLIENAGMPRWWPPFCGAYDVGAAVWLALLMRVATRSGRTVGGEARVGLTR